jgi:MFS family permease
MSLSRDRQFLKYWTASAISDVGAQLTALAIPLIGALSLNATPWQMGLLTAMSTVPILLVGLFAGVLVDRVRRRPLLIASDIGRAAMMLVIPMASLMGVLRIELLYVVAFLLGSLSLVFDVAHLAFLPSLVPREHLVDGNAKLEVTAANAQVLGPGLGGVLIGLVGAPLALLLDASTLLISAALIAWTRATEAPRAMVREGASVWQDIREGLRVVFGNPTLCALMGCSATLNLFGRMFLAVYVLFMTRDLGFGPIAVGLILATGGLGSLAGALVGKWSTRRFGYGPTIIGSAAAFGLAGLMVPLAILFPRIAIPMLVLSEFGQWAAILVYFVGAITVRQAMTHDRLMGRVNATIRFVAGGALPIGALAGGALGGLIGLPLTLVVAELGTLLGVVWLVLSPVRSLRALPSEPVLG